MKRFAIALAAVLAVTLALGTGYALGRTTSDQYSLDTGSAIVKSPGAGAANAAPESPSMSPSPSISPNPEPTTVEPDGDWEGPKGSMTFTGSDAVALTFDDGPSDTWTPQVLGLLRSHGVKATFCVVGTQVKEYPELLKSIVADGHSLCNHSWNHEMDLGKAKAKDIRKNLQRTNDAIHAAVPDAKISYYRQPGGKWTNRIVKVAQKMGMAPLHWSVDPSDWDKAAKAGQIERRIITATGPGSIVLMHDGGGDRSRTFNALDGVLANLTSRFSLIALP